MLTKALANIGFKLFFLNLCIFKYRSEIILLIVYIDDILISVLKKATIALIIRAIETYFKLKKLNNIKYFLDINIKQDRINYCIFFLRNCL